MAVTWCAAGTSFPVFRTTAGDGMNRYMVFNAGRHRGYRRRLSGRRDLPPSAIATASGVGTDGDDLFVAALGALRAGVPVENPRQIPAYRYSARYGPIPPCFSRATLELEPKRLFVGGTSSVCGEDSVHPEVVRRSARRDTREPRRPDCRRGAVRGCSAATNRDRGVQPRPCLRGARGGWCRRPRPSDGGRSRVPDRNRRGAAVSCPSCWSRSRASLRSDGGRRDHTDAARVTAPDGDQRATGMHRSFDAHQRTQAAFHFCRDDQIAVGPCGRGKLESCDGGDTHAPRPAHPAATPLRARRSAR